MADDAGRLNQVFAETSFLYGSSAAFIEDLHAKWANDPSSVSAEWRAFFDQLRDNAAAVKASAEAGAWGRSVNAEPTEETGVFDGRWPAPKDLSAAMRNKTACGAVVAVTAIRSSGLMSATDRIAGLLVYRARTASLQAAMPCRSNEPLVLRQAASRAVGP